LKSETGDDVNAVFFDLMKWGLQVIGQAEVRYSAKYPPFDTRLIL